MFLFRFLGFLINYLIVFSMYLLCSLVETGVHSNYPLKHHAFFDKNPRKMNQKHHQKIEIIAIDEINTLVVFIL